VPSEPVLSEPAPAEPVPLVTGAAAPEPAGREVPV